MGLRDRLRRRRAAPAPSDARQRAVPIAEMPFRRPTTLAGEVTAVRIIARSTTSSLEVELHDATGVAVAVFTGRQSIPGIATGRGLLVEGVARRDGGRIVLLNPGYQLLE